MMFLFGTTQDLFHLFTLCEFIDELVQIPDLFHQRVLDVFDPDAANKTHIPWPSEYPLPWKK